MTSPTNRTDEVARQIVEVYEYNLQFPKEDRFKDLENDIASAITSAVEQERAKLERIAEHRLKCAVEAERERCAKAAENGLAYSSGIEIATAIRQTPTQGER